MMSGTHGTEDGVSALTELETKMVDNAGRTIDIDLIDHGFYQEDCRMVGIEAGPMRSNQRPPLMFQEPFTEVDWMRLPDITKPAEKPSYNLLLQEEGETDQRHQKGGVESSASCTTPLWYDAPNGYPKRAILEKISETEEISGLSVTVVYRLAKERDEGVAEFCLEKEWNYRDLDDMKGCEDECIIDMNCLQPETISRPHNLLVVVTTPDYQ